FLQNYFASTRGGPNFNVRFTSSQRFNLNLKKRSIHKSECLRNAATSFLFCKTWPRNRQQSCSTLQKLARANDQRRNSNAPASDSKNKSTTSGIIASSKTCRQFFSKVKIQFRFVKNRFRSLVRNSTVVIPPCGFTPA